MYSRPRPTEDSRNWTSGSAHVATVGLLALTAILATALQDLTASLLGAIWSYLVGLTEIETWYWLAEIQLPF